MREIVFIEGPAVAQFWPLGVSRPPYLLRCGSTMLWEKWVRKLSPAQASFCCRPHLASLVTARTGRPANQRDNGRVFDTWVLDGRWLLSTEDALDPELMPAACRLRCGEHLVGIRIGELPDRRHLMQTMVDSPECWPEMELPEVEVPGIVLEYLWDLVDQTPEQIGVDFAAAGAAGPAQWPAEAIDQSAVVLRPDRVRIGARTEVGPQVVLDARGGPILLGAGVTLNPFTHIEGPAAVGDDARIYGGKIRAGTAIGPGCRIGGEVEASVFLGYANKYHDGFIGHCVVGEWVNLGALTTNSDVKNNYRPVRVQLAQRVVETGRIKVGAFLADHTKTGIGTLLPTGGTVGFASNIFGGGTVGPKTVPEFLWVGDGAVVEYRLMAAKQTAAEMCRRRGVEFGEQEARTFDVIFEQSKPYRDAMVTVRGES